MKILTAAEMRAADGATFEQIGLPSRAAMESAGRQAAAFLLGNYPKGSARGTLVLTGKGNNGGDGFVIARALLNLGLPVEVLSTVSADEQSGDALSAADAYSRSGGQISEYSKLKPEDIAPLFETGVIVDAIFGTGLRGAITGAAAQLIDTANRISASKQIPIVAIDVPSGLDSDSGEVHGTLIRAHSTIALQCLKVGHVSFPGAEYCGEVYLADIGIAPMLPEILAIQRELITAEGVQEILRGISTLSAQAHKGTRGHVLVLGGSDGKDGAPRLSALAALRSGAGLATVVAAGVSTTEFSSSTPEIMCEVLPDNAESTGKLASFLKGKDAIVAGPGLGQSKFAAALLRELFKFAGSEGASLVVDADALNILGSDPALRKALPPGSVLTPHPGEMARLTGTSVEQIQKDRLTAAAKLSAELDCILVLKGARTVVAAPSGKVFVNPASTPVLGTGGSGDALAGIISALLAQGITQWEAAIAGVFVHGLAGEMLQHENSGVFGAVAGDIIGTVPKIMNALVGEDLPTEGKFLRKIFPLEMFNDASVLARFKL